MNPNTIVPHIKNIPPSGIREFFEMVLEMPDVLSLGVGEPDFVTPWHITENAIFHLEDGYTTYTSNQGLAALRKQISKSLKQNKGIDYDPDNIIITVGVSEAVDIAIRSIIKPDDKVIVVEPSFVSYIPEVLMSHGIPISIETKGTSGFKLTPEVLDNTIKENNPVKAMIFNYPCNPTGTTYTYEELEALSKIIKKHELIVLSDEIYDELSYEIKHISLPIFNDIKDNVIYLNGFSKAYAMTGWRIGFACAHKDIIKNMNKIHQYMIMCAPVMGQFAAIEALKKGRDAVTQMVNEYKSRRDYLIEKLNKIGLECHLPGGAFYAFPSCKNTGLSSKDFAMKLLETEKVAVVPGTAFGKCGEGYLRISYASSMKVITEAVHRMEKFLSMI